MTSDKFLTFSRRQELDESVEPKRRHAREASRVFAVPGVKLLSFAKRQELDESLTPKRPQL